MKIASAFCGGVGGWILLTLFIAAAAAPDIGPRESFIKYFADVAPWTGLAVVGVLILVGSVVLHDRGR